MTHKRCIQIFNTGNPRAIVMGNFVCLEILIINGCTKLNSNQLRKEDWRGATISKVNVYFYHVHPVHLTVYIFNPSNWSIVGHKTFYNALMKSEVNCLHCNYANCCPLEQQLFVTETCVLKRVNI